MTLESTPKNASTPVQNQQAPERSRREFKTILSDRLPCWYEMSWETEGPALVLRVHKSYADSLSVRPDAPIVTSFQNTFGLGSFVGDLGGNFGFNDALKNRGEKDGFYEYGIEIPTIKSLSDSNCDRCNGSGRDQELDMTCTICDGEGKAPFYDWKHAHEVSTTLHILTMRLFYPDHDVPTTLPQLLTFESSGASEHSALHGEISIALKEWLASGAAGTQFPSAVAAMEAAYKKMFGPHLGFVTKHRFEARHKSGGLIVSCPGEACGIYPADWNFRAARGYKFSSHNVDNPAQQLQLLAGLAAIHDFARKRNVGVT